VRAVAFSQSVFKSKTGDDAILQAFHVLNQFDIPKGSARDNEKDANGNIQADYTLWTAASDLKTKRYYFHTYENRQIRMLDLMKMDVDGKNIVKISITGEGAIKSLTQ
jgi:choloylglycine hydrolase